MKATLKIEAINDNIKQQTIFYKKIYNEIFPEMGNKVFSSVSRYWVAEILGNHPLYKYNRKFISGKKDYTHANSKGSRGVFVWYILETGKIYEILKPISRRNSCRYFCKVTIDGDIVEIKEKEVCEWINAY